jgi:hypothetical protein
MSGTAYVDGETVGKVVSYSVVWAPDEGCDWSKQSGSPMQNLVAIDWDALRKPVRCIVPPTVNWLMITAIAKHFSVTARIRRSEKLPRAFRNRKRAFDARR